jgi:hypothetical protein
MRRKSHKIQFCLGALLCVGLLAVPVGARAEETTIARKPPPPDYFPLRYKYWWKYQSKTVDGTISGFTIKDIHDDRQSDKSIWHELETTPLTGMHIRDWYSKGDGLVLNHHETYGDKMQAEFLPPKKFLKNPLVDGDTWEWAGKGMMAMPVTEKSTVSGPEEITVPAGTFKAMKVEALVTQGGMPVTKTYWYGPNVGLVKSRTQSGTVISNTELVEYQFPKLEPGELEAELDKAANRP